MIIKLTSQEVCAALEKWLNNDFLKAYQEVIVDAVRWEMDAPTTYLVIIAHKKKPEPMIMGHTKPDEK